MKKPTPEAKPPRKYLTRMMRCPKHTMTVTGEDVANCAVYSDGTYYCFGCGARGKV